MAKKKKEHQSFVGSDHAPTEEEAYKMGLALFDAIASGQAKKAREKKPSK
jgi:hypothetical protein